MIMPIEHTESNISKMKELANKKTDSCVIAKKFKVSVDDVYRFAQVYDIPLLPRKKSKIYDPSTHTSGY
jgi:serine kinase of HPr protein (carbohydrate metabolism regulator)